MIAGIAHDMLAKMVADIPKPQDGKSVTLEEALPHLKQHLEGLVESRFEALEIPDPGPGIAGAIQNHEGELVLTLTNGKQLNVGKVKGADGFSPDDLEVSTDDGGRTIRLVLKSGNREVTRELLTETIIDRGVWQSGHYDAGDAVTLKGSLWIATESTRGRPGDQASGWRLAVKRGRDQVKERARA